MVHRVWDSSLLEETSCLVGMSSSKNAVAWKGDKCGSWGGKRASTCRDFRT